MDRCLLHFPVQICRPTGTKSTAFWRENVPGKLPCDGLQIHEMEGRHKRKEITEINLFPFPGQCRYDNNYTDQFIIARNPAGVEAQIKSMTVTCAKLPDAKQRIKYLLDGEHSSEIAQICM